MEQTTFFSGEVMILSGREVFLIPCLAVVGAASIIGGLGYGVYRLGRKMVTKLSNEKEKES